MPATRPLRPFFAALLAGTVLLAGCSGEDEAAKPPLTGTQVSPDASEEVAAEETGPYLGLEPAQILTQVNESLTNAKSVRVKADLLLDGERTKMNIQVNRAGRVKGKWVTEADGSMTVIIIGKKGWMLPGKDMLAKISGGDTAVEEYMAGKWIPFGPDDPDMGEMFQLVSMDALLSDTITEEDLASELVTVKGKPFAGRETIGIKKKGTKGAMFVAADGSGELVAYRDQDGVIQYSGWNQKLQVKPPTKVFTEEELA